MEKVIITGATGIIGVNLCKYFLNKNVKVLAIIRENSARKKDLPNNKNLQILECDLSKLENLNLLESDYDIFYHLGWEASDALHRNDVYIQSLNIKYTLDAIKLAKRSGCNTFIGAGSQAEYGRVQGIISPDTNTNPENGYGIAKLCAGQLGKILANQIGIKFIWPRIFSIYGPNDSENTMISISIENMLKGNSPEYTLGEQDWDYLYIDDAVRALDLLAQKGINNKIYCIGYGNSRKLFEYIEIMKNKINPSIKLKLGAKPYSINQVMSLKVDVSDLEKDIGFVPSVSFEDGIEKTINWYKNSR